MNIVIVDCFDTWEHRVDLLCNLTYQMVSFKSDIKAE